MSKTDQIPEWDDLTTFGKAIRQLKAAATLILAILMFLVLGTAAVARKEWRRLLPKNPRA